LLILKVGSEKPKLKKKPTVHVKSRLEKTEIEKKRVVDVKSRIGTTEIEKIKKSVLVLS
jgi:hypothetical protein